MVSDWKKQWESRTMVCNELDKIELSETEKQKRERDMQGVGNR